MSKDFQVTTLVTRDELVGLVILDAETGDEVAQVSLRYTMPAEQRRQIGFRIADLIQQRRSAGHAGQGRRLRGLRPCH